MIDALLYTGDHENGPACSLLMTFQTGEDERRGCACWFQLRLKYIECDRSKPDPSPLIIEKSWHLRIESSEDYHRSSDCYHRFGTSLAGELCKYECFGFVP